MVALPIGGLAFAATAIHTSVPSDADRVAGALGSADFSVYDDGTITLEELRSKLPEGTRIVSSGVLTASPVLNAHRVYLSMYEYDASIAEPPLRGIYRVLDGRAPTAAGEVAVHPDVLEALGLNIGDTLEPRPNVVLRVTGTIVRGELIKDRIGVLGPGTLAPMGRELRAGWMVDLPPDADVTAAIAALDPLYERGYVVDARVVLEGHGRDEREATGLAFAAGALLLLGTGLIAGAAFAVGARRQLRVLGLLGAAGAEPNHVRATVLMGGVTLGFLGSLLGVLLGVAGTYALSPLLDRLAGRVVGSVDIPVSSLAGTVALGTLAATLAAYGPARSASKVSVVNALAERSQAPRRPGRLAVAGIVAAAAGAVVTSLATAAHADLALVAGLVAMVVGFLVAIPLLVTWTGRIAGALPTLTRIATRDVARNGRRAGAAIAAAAIALAAPVALSTATLAGEASEERIPYMAPDHLLVQGLGRGDRGVEAVRVASAALLDAFPGSIAVSPVPAVTTIERNGRERERLVVVPGAQQFASDGTPYVINGYLLIGGRELLHAYHAEDAIAALERGEIVGLGPDTVEGDSIDLVVEGSGDPFRSNLPAAETPSQYQSINVYGLGFVISPERAAELGLRPSSKPAYAMTQIFRASHALDQEDVRHAREVVETSGRGYVTSPYDLGSDEGLARTVASLVGMGLALAIVAVVVALLAAESRRDRAILVAVGAAPATRRAVAGLYAAVVGALAGVLGLLAGFFPTVAFLFGQPTDYPIFVPWTVLAGVLLGVPAIAGAIGALASREPRAAQLLRPIA